MEFIPVATPPPSAGSFTEKGKMTNLEQAKPLSLSEFRLVRQKRIHQRPEGNKEERKGKKNACFSLLLSTLTRD